MDNFKQLQKEYNPNIDENRTSFFNRIRYYLIQIWPYVNRFLNFIFYWIIKTIKGIVKYAIRQIRPPSR